MSTVKLAHGYCSRTFACTLFNSPDTTDAPSYVWPTSLEPHSIPAMAEKTCSAKAAADWSALTSENLGNVPPNCWQLGKVWSVCRLIYKYRCKGGIFDFGFLFHSIKHFLRLRSSHFEYDWIIQRKLCRSQRDVQVFRHISGASWFVVSQWMTSNVVILLFQVVPLFFKC